MDHGQMRSAHWLFNFANFKPRFALRASGVIWHLLRKDRSRTLSTS